jgi:hypothetical protein
MRLIHLTLAGLCVVLIASGAIAKEKKPQKQMDMQAMMETYSKLATPGEPHKQFASLAGSWTTKTKSWMEPNKPPVESAGSCEQTMLLGGRFLQQECTGDMMGQQFTGLGVNGYDNHTKKYVSTWMDSMGTGIYYMEGRASADGKTITQKGQYDDPMEGRMKLRGVTKIVGNDTEIFEMYGTGKNGKERRMMEIIYTRKP